VRGRVSPPLTRAHVSHDEAGPGSSAEARGAVCTDRL